MLCVCPLPYPLDKSHSSPVSLVKQLSLHLWSYDLTAPYKSIIIIIIIIIIIYYKAQSADGDQKTLPCSNQVLFWSYFFASFRLLLQAEG